MYMYIVCTAESSEYSAILRMLCIDVLTSIQPSLDAFYTKTMSFESFPSPNIFSIFFSWLWNKISHFRADLVIVLDLSMN